MKVDRSLWMFGGLSAVLALMPVFPEPHLWGKIKWVSGGAVGMKTVDWLDMLFHGGPLFIFLFMVGIQLGKKRISS